MKMRTFAIALVALLMLLPAASSFGQWCDEQVRFVTYDGTIEMHHSQAEYNCCAWIEFEVVQEEFEIDVFEWERFETGPCYCLCCFDLKVVIGGLEPGIYVVTLWKDGLFYGSWEVPVEGFSAPFVETQYIPCVETGAPEIGMGSWGMIKALYRE